MVKIPSKCPLAVFNDSASVLRFLDETGPGCGSVLEFGHEIGIVLFPFSCDVMFVGVDMARARHVQEGILSEPGGRLYRIEFQSEGGTTEIHCFKTNLGNLAVGLLGAAGTSETAPPAPTSKAYHRGIASRTLSRRR